MNKYILYVYMCIQKLDISSQHRHNQEASFLEKGVERFQHLGTASSSLLKQDFNCSK